MHRFSSGLAGCLLIVAVAACTADGPGAAVDGSTADKAVRAPSRTARPSPSATEDGGEQASPAAGTPRPAWLGARELPRREDGFGQVRATPRVLRDRRLQTVDLLPVPGEGQFEAKVRPVPEQVAGRSTWRRACPVSLDALRYVTVTFWGFDAAPHTGELLVHHAVAEDLVDVLRRLYLQRFPIEEMRIVDTGELDSPPTGDGNNTTAFVCRPTTGGDGWSEHAFGLAIDVNPFHNPYVKDDLVVPELASAYTDRAWRRPGMVTPAVVAAFAAVGWEWGGDWVRPKDWMHFSREGR